MNPIPIQSVQLHRLLEPVDAELGRVRRHMTDVLSDAAAPVGEYLSQLDIGGGKMLRPALVLLSGASVGGLRDEHIELAAIVEMIHLASLLHDDVIDQAQMRRGKASANALWGNTQAVLLGDFVLSKAFGMGTTLELSGAATILCQTAEAICTGEIMQNSHKGNRNLSEAEYLTIIEGKTASLFGACCQLGALAAGAEPPVQQAFRDYGVALGLAFQMTDDLLDILGDAAKEGKTLGGDLLNEKLTLPVIFWLAQNDGKHRQERLLLLEENADVCEAIARSGAVEYTLARTEAYARRAHAGLRDCPDSAAKKALAGLISYVHNRV